MLSVLDPWPTWIWASVGRDLGTWGTSDERDYGCRDREAQLTSHLPLPNAVPFSYQE